MKKKVAIITSHPIQYQAPLFRKLNKSKYLKILVFFGSKHGYVSKKKDLEFNKLINWNTNILSGYKFFFSNKEKDIDSFWVSFDQIKKKFIEEKIDKVLIFGWNKLIYLQATIAALSLGIPIYLRAENNLEKKNSLLKGLSKKLIFNLFFKVFDKIFYIGKLNKSYYQHYGVKNNKLIFTPYHVDYNFLRSSVTLNKTKKIKKKLRLKKKDKIVLFIGKLIDRKNPYLLLEYAKKIKLKCKFLIVGDGPLLKILKKKIKEEKLNNIELIGFKNQREIANYYKVSDYLFLTSKYETWGLVVNEAFAHYKPCIVTDKCGSRKDLVDDFKTGIVVKSYFTNKSLKKISNFIKVNTSIFKKNIKEKNKIYSINYCFRSMEKILK